MSKPKQKKNRLIIAAVVIGIAVIGLSTLNLQENIVYFYTPEEVVPAPQELIGKTIKVGGMVMPGSVVRDTQNVILDFTATDNQGHDIRVRFKGTPPDLFKEGQGVVVEGKLDGKGNMAAVHLLVKHSEEYRKPDDHTNMDKALLEKSLFK